MNARAANTIADHHESGRVRVLALTAMGVVLFVASYFLPYWSFKLVAPQYPKGLVLRIGLQGVSGDVHEIDIINHYIGMHAISEAAELERAAGPYLVAAIVLAIVVGMIVAGRKMNWGGLVPAFALPIGFLVTTLYWMYEFGHDLDPTAAIDFKPFMPTLVGTGTIGQFHTYAAPAVGFWFAIAGSLAVTAALYFRKRVCDTCPARASCRGAFATHNLLYGKVES